MSKSEDRWDTAERYGRRWLSAQNLVSTVQQVAEGDVKGFVTSLAIMETTFLGAYFAESILFAPPYFGPGYDLGPRVTLGRAYALRNLGVTRVAYFLAPYLAPVAVVASIVAVSAVTSYVAVSAYEDVIKDLPEDEQKSMWKGYSAALSGGFSVGSYQY